MGEPLLAAIAAADAAALQALLEASADPNSLVAASLFSRIQAQYPQVDVPFYSWSALHEACWRDSSACVAALLAAGADAAVYDSSFTLLHCAMQANSAGAVRALLAAAPQAAWAPDSRGDTLPLELALRHDGLEAALVLLQHATLQPASKLLMLLKDARRSNNSAMQRLYVPLAARQPLTAEQWSRLPMPCTGLGAALAAVLQRSADEAGRLVRHLPAEDAARLRTAALCLEQVQRRRRVALPPEVTRRLLAQALAE